MRTTAILLLPVLLALVPVRPGAAPADDEKAVGAVLDDFHDAAARADEERYFGHFSPEGVFMGTDASERWTVKAFRQWAHPYFQRASAWTLTPRTRHIHIAPGGAVAWFDEVVDSASFGECRGTGVLRKVAGRWKIAHYSLTVPVPNDLLPRVAEMIRARTRGAGRRAATTVFLVRHAEKVVEPGNADPPLSPRGRRRALELERVLAPVRLAAIYATEFRRTRETVAPTARSQGVTPTIRKARAVRDLARDLRGGPPGRSVLVAGHSDTLPALIRELGVPEAVTLGEDQYENLFIVTLHPSGSASLVRLHFGAPR